MQKNVILTKEGMKNLEEELDFLKIQKRKEVAEKIKQALAFGDLSENSEYDEAKNEQGVVEARIVQIEAMLKNAKILDNEDISTDTVMVGTKVRALDMEYNEEVLYQIVGSTEANPTEFKISNESPVGKAFTGHKVGDIVIVEAPVGEIKFEILEIGR